jgi:carboxyl-terminal processing protease
VPKEPEKDTQLQYALKFLRGEATGETLAKPAVQPPSDAQNTEKGVPN